MSMIKYLITINIRDYLRTYLNAGISEVSPVYVKTIDSFNYLKNPTVDGTRVIVYGDNPNEIEYRDARIDLSGAQRTIPNLGITIPAGEIGGGYLWWRRGIVTVQFFGIGKLQQQTNYDAADVAYTILGRVQNCLGSIRFQNLVDEFGERALKLFAYSSNFKESGGNRTNIWEGDVYWQALTERAN